MNGVDLALELQKIYDSEINVTIRWLWDGGIDVRLGDEMNGLLAEETMATVLAPGGHCPFLSKFNLRQHTSA